MITYKNKHRICLKIITMGVVCLFFLSSLSFADLQRSTLSAKLALNDPAKSAELRAALICELIEKRAQNWDGRTIEEIYTDDMLLWQRSSEPLFEGVVPELSADKTEIAINIPASNVSIRYYDPLKNKTLAPHANWQDTKTHVINDRINRQIIHEA